MKNQDEIKEIRKIIEKEMEHIGYKFKYKGSYYLEEAILEVYLNRHKFIENLQGEIYPSVAKRFNKTIKAIKNGIMNSTEYMYRECEMPRLKEYFRLDKDDIPSVKDVIFTIINKIA